MPACRSVRTSATAEHAEAAYRVVDNPHVHALPDLVRKHTADVFGKRVRCPLLVEQNESMRRPLEIGHQACVFFARILQNFEAIAVRQRRAGGRPEHLR